MYFSRLKNSIRLDIKDKISHLLYKYDCVVVPGFGGFIGSYTPAEVNPRSNILTPPSKKIVFNNHLRTDDGLLIHHLAINENRDYQEVKLEVEATVRQWEHDITNSGQLIFPGIGNISRQKEGNLVFTPEENLNYLESSFGLEPVTSPPVDRRHAHRPAARAFIDRKPVSKKKRRSAAYWTVAAAVPAVFLLLWFVFGGYPLHFDRQDKTGMMPENVISNPVVQDEKQPSNMEATTPEIKDMKNNENEGEALPSYTRNDEEEKVPDEPDVVRQDKLRYFIIGGAFREEENVRKLIEKLTLEGYRPMIAGTTPAGLTMVSIEAFAGRNEALAALDNIRNEVNPNAWLHRKH